MNALKRFWRSLFDVRPGEYAVTGLMALYLMLVLFAYYILKPVSRALFLNNFDIDKLPWLYILIASIGGVLAYFYTKVAVNSSLKKAVNFATIFCVLVLVLFWWLIQLKFAWVIYAFNVWVSLFSVILVSQGWLVAANVFSSREAKRLYSILGVGSVIGAAFGGQFTAIMVYYVGNTNLVLACAFMVILSYLAYLAAIKASGKTLRSAKAAHEEEHFSFSEVIGSVKRLRHLQVIIGIIMITFMVDVMVEYQFSAYAKMTYQGRDLTAFLGNFYGFWLNLVTFVLQLFLTSFVVSRFGVGGTLQIMPVSIAAASVASLVAPSLLSTAAARLTEASTRYSFNKTGMELLYLPLPLELRNRTKAFVDVFVDRFSRGLGGILLVLLPLDPHRFSIVVMILAGVWILLSIAAQREYISTIRRRLELRRLDLESARVTVSDRATITMLEQTARGNLPRQAAYALELLSEAPGYSTEMLASELVSSAHVEVRAKVYEVSRKANYPALLDAALAEIRNARTADRNMAARAAVQYAIEVTPDPIDLSRRLLEHRNPEIPASVLDALATKPELAHEIVDRDWLQAASSDSSPSRRALAAQAIGIRGDSGTEALFPLLSDRETTVRAQAIRTVGALKNREYLTPVVRSLASPRLRGVAIDALVEFGPRIIGTLSDLLEDETAALNIRRYIPRVLQRIPDQRSVDVLVRTLPVKDLALRATILKALNKLRDTNPDLDFHAKMSTEQILEEAKYYFELHASLAPLRAYKTPPTATALLVRTLEDRLRITLERLFRLLGLRYPQRQIYAAYLAINKRTGEDFTAAVDFLDNVLERELKKVLLPLLDEDIVLAQHGRDLFRIETKDVRGALQSMMRSNDPWLAACAIAATVELNIRDLTEEIRVAATSCGPEVADVARAAEAGLA